MQASIRSSQTPAAWQFAVCNAGYRLRRSSNRRGGVYIAVLGTSLIVALLGLSALMAQRIQNRMLVASTDIGQAKLNAESAVDLGLLTIKQNNSWRSLRDGQSFLYTNRSTGDGACSLQVPDALSDAADAADRPFKLIGIGYHGPDAGDAPRTAAEQRVELAVDPRRQPHDCLRNGSTTPPDWNAVFAYYQANGTPIATGSLPDVHPVANFAVGRNPGMEDEQVSEYPPHWVGNGPGTGSADVDRSNNQEHSGTYSLRVRARTSQFAGPSHSVRHFLKPLTPYLIEVWVRAEDFSSVALVWRFTLRTKTIGIPASSPVSLEATESLPSGGWLKLSGTLTSNDWTGVLEYAWLTVSCDDVWVGLPLLGHFEDPDFFMDDFLVKEATTASTGRFIYKQALGPGYNQLYAGAPTNPNGLYWIDCKVNGVNQNLIIERSRIRGTLLILNPGPDSRIDYGPIHISSHIPGYPALLVNGNFAVRATSSLLSEPDNGVNYNPPGGVGTPGVVHKIHQTDEDPDDVYDDSGIQGLVAVFGTLTYKYTPQIWGRVIVGGNGGVPLNLGTPTVTYVPDSLLNPPPPFYAYRYDRRPNSTRKVVLP